MRDHVPLGSSAWKGAQAISVFIIVLCWSSGMFSAASTVAQQKDDRQRYGQRSPTTWTISTVSTAETKIAEGEYAIYEEANSGAFGPFGEEVYNFHESWTLWRTEKGQYRVEGKRKFESPKYAAHTNRFLVELSRDLTVMRVTEFAQLKWRNDSGPLTCEFLSSELHCSSGASDPKQAIELRIPMEHPFGLLWPVSVFSFSGITREAERDPAQATQVEFVRIEQPSRRNPVEPTILSGPLRYLGEEDIEAAGQKWQARKFSLKVALNPEFLIWTSSKGILLAFAVEHAHANWPQEGMKLVRFTMWADF
jgi:hypothetical protein